MKPPCLIALMVRVPVAGLVKTRLIPALGAEGACQLYRAMVDDLLEQATATGMELQLFYTGGGSEHLPQAWRQAAQSLSPQQGVNLGARMAHALTTACKTAARVLLIGSDIPDMDATMLRNAAAALRRHEVVLAPAVDGGYCLMGLNRGIDIAPIFQNMPWSTDQVLAITQHRLAELGRRVHLLSPLRDIDTPADLLAYQHHPNPAAHRVNRVLADVSPASPIAHHPRQPAGKPEQP